MSEPAAQVYTRTCNPSRRAKRSRIAPEPLYLESEASDDGRVDSSSSVSSGSLGYIPPDEAPLSRSATAPAKRGRKPSTMSRAAREAQRKLNHSIIEKARRTKINGALATLRELVPQEHKRSKDDEEDEEDSGDDDDDDDFGAKTPKKSRAKSQPKEYKLDILVRAVAFMQDLIVKVENMEQQIQSLEGLKGKKRKRSVYVDDNDVAMDDGDQSEAGLLTRCDSLPSFSTLFASANLGKDHPCSTRTYLPSPPSSTQFHPTKTLPPPPALTLDTDTRAKSSLHLRTPEDERAANLLLGISNSPPLAFPLKSASSSVPSYDLAQDSETHGSRRGAMPRRDSRMVIGSMNPQTPSSLLGMNKPVG